MNVHLRKIPSQNSQEDVFIGMEELTSLFVWPDSGIGNGCAGGAKRASSVKQSKDGRDGIKVEGIRTCCYL